MSSIRQTVIKIDDQVTEDHLAGHVDAGHLYGKERTWGPCVRKTPALRRDRAFIGARLHKMKCGRRRTRLKSLVVSVTGHHSL